MSDCFEPVCEKDDPLGSMNKIVNRIKKSQEFDEEEIISQEKDIECPLKKQTLGYFTWSFLHTMAIYYPDKPTTEQKEKMTQFVHSFAEFYPCIPCRQHFQKEIIEYPVQVDSRESLSIWFCQRHNVVSKWLGKPQFECTLEKLDERWRKGYKKCQENNMGSYF